MSDRTSNLDDSVEEEETTVATDGFTTPVRSRTRPSTEQYRSPAHKKALSRIGHRTRWYAVDDEVFIKLSPKSKGFKHHARRSEMEEFEIEDDSIDEFNLPDPSDEFVLPPTSDCTPETFRFLPPSDLDPDDTVPPTAPTVAVAPVVSTTSTPIAPTPIAPMPIAPIPIAPLSITPSNPLLAPPIAVHPVPKSLVATIAPVVPELKLAFWNIENLGGGINRPFKRPAKHTQVMGNVLFDTDADISVIVECKVSAPRPSPPLLQKWEPRDPTFPLPDMKDVMDGLHVAPGQRLLDRWREISKEFDADARMTDKQKSQLPDGAWWIDKASSTVARDVQEKIAEDLTGELRPAMNDYIKELEAAHWKHRSGPFKLTGNGAKAIAKWCEQYVLERRKFEDGTDKAIEARRKAYQQRVEEWKALGKACTGHIELIEILAQMKSRGARNYALWPATDKDAESYADKGEFCAFIYDADVWALQSRPLFPDAYEKRRPNQAIFASVQSPTTVLRVVAWHAPSDCESNRDARDKDFAAFRSQCDEWRKQDVTPPDTPVTFLAADLNIDSAISGGHDFLAYCDATLGVKPLWTDCTTLKKSGASSATYMTTTNYSAAFDKIFLLANKRKSEHVSTQRFDMASVDGFAALGSNYVERARKLSDHVPLLAHYKLQR